ncbi:ARM repeat-containing protein [Irpex rosettiformis]|uniref:ARM repeat-containing protein n=1 Tax=Irpex rosettiformis TaxID=378272 RepID=A0ACB8TW61_9APHY|nr:ARM repeat-containing protein [Irpex rosettiformis]
MAITEITLSSLKQIKNSVIGNPTAKRALAQDEAFIGTLVTFLYERDVQLGLPSDSEDELRIEAAHILASLSYGSPEALRPLLKTNALPAMVLAISTRWGPPSPLSVKIALARVMKTLGAAAVDIVGPAQWGLHANHPEILEDAKTALDNMVTIEALDVCLSLLTSSSSQISMAMAQLLTSTLRLPAHRTAVSKWVPPSERNKEVKGKRGWEKADSSSSPSKQGGWVARQLIALIQKKDVKLQEAALSALAALTRDNPPVANGLAGSTPDHSPILPIVLSSCKSRNTDLQLAACLCASNIFRASHAPHAVIMDQSAPMTVIHVMNGLIEAENESPQTRMKACYILYYLVADEKDLCQLAYERGSLAKLAQLVKSITPSDSSALPNWDEDEPDSTSTLRAAALTAIAAISLFDTDIRGEVSGNLKLIPYIQVSLFHRHVGVRYAACQCVRALSRAVAVLRTNLVDSGLGLAVYEVFCKGGEDVRVTHAAASVICNIISDFSPLQGTLLEQGVIERLVRLLQSGESNLMLDALWAFKNLLYKSTLELKRRVMHALCWSTVASLLNHENPGFQEQTFHILRNLADTHEGIAMIFDELGSEFLLGSLSHALESDNDDVLRQAVYLTGNLSNSTTHSHEILSHARILQSLRMCLVDAKVDVRRPAVTCVLQLIKANPGSYKELHESGIDSTLRHMCDYGGGIMASSPTSTRFHNHHYHMGVEDDREVKDKARDALNRLHIAFPELE